MKRIITYLTLCFVLCLQAQAQLEIGLKSVRHDYILGENIILKLGLRNITDREIILDNVPNRFWLHFTVTNQENPNGIKMLARPKFPKVVVPAGRTIFYDFNIRPFFAFNRAGNYKVIATARMLGQRNNFSSGEVRFTLASGASLKKFNIQHKEQSIELHARMAIVGNQSCIFGQAIDGNTRVPLNACFMGQYLNFMEPIFRIDSAQNMHMLCQSTPKYFTYAVMSPVGKRVSYQLYTRTSGPVNLVSAGGKIRVVGAVPKKKDSPSGKPPARISTDMPF